MQKPVIVFTGAVYPGQFGKLCEYLRAANLAETYFLTTPGHQKRAASTGSHILAFEPDGPIVGPQSYYYSSKIERSARIGRGLLKALQTFEQSRKIDVVVSHSLWGAPHFLYDEIDAAIISYIEFPSYRAHGWDPAYPPDLAQRLGDRNSEMLHFHQALRSDLVICPSHHAKQMFPSALQSNIEVQLEGFHFETRKDTNAVSAPTSQPSPDPDPPEAAHAVTIGFAARDLSSAKGFETYVRLVEKLVVRGVRADFVALGGADESTYGYEAQWVQRNFKGELANFRDYLLNRYPKAATVIRFPGKLPYDDFVRQLSQIDLFLYPLQYGVANWGLVEILGRGGCVLAPDRGYATELIQHGVSGLLLPDDDDQWIDAIISLMADPARRFRYGQQARALTRLQYSMAAVAPRYMTLFRKAVTNRAKRLSGA